MRTLLPRPYITVMLTVMWMMLNNDFGLSSLLLGLFFGWFIPLVMDPILLKRRFPWHPWKLALLLALVTYDIIVSNFHVAKLNLGPVNNLRPAFLEVPIDLQNEIAISVLVSIVSMTPGTLSADLSEDKRTLLVHGLDVDDPNDIIAEIKHRYERRLKEIYPC